MTWQFNWRVWHWPWHLWSYEFDYWHPPYYSHYAGIGPFQFHWYASRKSLTTILNP